MKNLFYIILTILFFGCYTLHKDAKGMYIYYKGSKTEILKDEKNNLYFINKKGRKVKLETLKPIEIGNPFKK